MSMVNSSNLKDATDQLHTDILWTMDKIVSKQVKKITSGIRKPWYDHDLKQKRQIVKKQGKKIV